MTNLSPTAQKLVLSITSVAVPLITALVSFNVLTTDQAVAVTAVVTAISNVLHTVWEPKQ